MTDAIKGLGQVHENTNGIFTLINSGNNFWLVSINSTPAVITDLILLKPYSVLFIVKKLFFSRYSVNLTNITRSKTNLILETFNFSGKTQVIKEELIRCNKGLIINIFERLIIGIWTSVLYWILYF